jgi:TRAP-type uncharacterized transport system substrate-binding protein
VKTRIIFGCLIAIIALSLIFSGCSSTSPSSTAPASTAAKPAATTTQAPPPPAGRTEYKIQFLAGRTDSAEYATTHGIADLINKNSSWLRASVVETSGLAANYELVVKRPEFKPMSFICGSAGNYSFITKPKGEAGGTGWDWTPYEDVRFIVRLNTQVHSFAVMDKNIKTMADFKGKRVFEGGKTATRYLSDQLILKEAGVYDSIKMQNGGFGEGATALKDGLIDVAIQNGLSPVVPTDFVPDATLQELTASKPTYFASYDKAAFVAAVKKYNLSDNALTLTKPKLLGPNQLDPIVVKYDPSMILADKSMPDDVVNEFFRIFLTNLNNLGDYHVTGKWITKQTIGYSGWAKEAEYHPAALKFMKDNAITIGVNPPELKDALN